MLGAGVGSECRRPIVAAGQPGQPGLFNRRQARAGGARGGHDKGETGRYSLMELHPRVWGGNGCNSRNDGQLDGLMCVVSTLKACSSPTRPEQRHQEALGNRRTRGQQGRNRVHFSRLADSVMDDGCVDCGRIGRKLPTRDSILGPAMSHWPGSFRPKAQRCHWRQRALANPDGNPGGPG